MTDESQLHPSGTLPQSIWYRDLKVATGGQEPCVTAQLYDKSSSRGSQVQATLYHLSSLGIYKKKYQSNAKQTFDMTIYFGSQGATRTSLSPLQRENLDLTEAMNKAAFEIAVGPCYDEAVKLAPFSIVPRETIMQQAGVLPLQYTTQPILDSNGKPTKRYIEPHRFSPEGKLPTLSGNFAVIERSKAVTDPKKYRSAAAYIEDPNSCQNMFDGPVSYVPLLNLVDTENQDVFDPTAELVLSSDIDKFVVTEPGHFENGKNVGGKFKFSHIDVITVTYGQIYYASEYCKVRCTIFSIAMKITELEKQLFAGMIKLPSHAGMSNGNKATKLPSKIVPVSALPANNTPSPDDAMEVLETPTLDTPKIAPTGEAEMPVSGAPEIPPPNAEENTMVVESPEEKKPTTKIVKKVIRKVVKKPTTTTPA